jgi:anti-sigma factor RsiW
MNCRDIESLILAERDGVLPPAQHATLSGHVAACPACQQLRANLGEAAAFLKTDAANVAMPDVDTEWRTLRAQLSGAAAKPTRKRPLAPIIWFSAPFAAAAALAIAFFVNRPAAPQSGPAQVAEHADASGATASTIAYVDKDSGWLVVWSTDAATKGSG